MRWQRLRILMLTSSFSCIDNQRKGARFCLALLRAICAAVPPSLLSVLGSKMRRPARAERRLWTCESVSFVQNLALVSNLSFNRLLFRPKKRALPLRRRGTAEDRSGTSLHRLILASALSRRHLVALHEEVEDCQEQRAEQNEVKPRGLLAS